MTATILKGESASDLFRSAIDVVLADGARVRPRGEPTREVLNVHFELVRPRARLVHVPPLRCLNAAFAAAESAWILSGSDDSWIFAYNNRLRDFADGGVLLGAYGPRLRRWGGSRVDQLRHVVELLRQDPDSRRAVVQLYDPSRDVAGHRDVPCTLGYRFHLRGGLLYMSTTMRSQDVWLGFPYDVYSSTVLQELVAGWLDAGLGAYSHHVDSLHLYESDLHRVAGELPAVDRASEMASLAVPWDRFDDVVANAIQGIVTGHQGWDVVMATMSSYRHWKRGERAAAWQVAETVDGPLGDSLRAWYGRLAAAQAPATAVRT